MSDNLFTIPPDVEMRWATAENPKGERSGACKPGINMDFRTAHRSDGRKVSPCLAPFRAGQPFTLAEVKGAAGMVRRLWITIDDRSPQMLRGIRLDMYWDGASAPAVSAPIGDFFCHGLGRASSFQNALFSSPEGRSFNCCVPMPFRTGMRIVATNESGKDLRMLFYEVDYSVGDRHGPDTLYFHAHWRRENPTTLRKDFEVLPKVIGRGRYLGACLGVIADTGRFFRSWWGEGEVKIFLDGDTRYPTLCGTGTEDYIGTGWGQGQYGHLYQGCPLADHDRLQFGFYRLHIPDPVYFRREARVTIQQIGCADANAIAGIRRTGFKMEIGTEPIDIERGVEIDGCVIFERQDDWSSCAYFYLDRPENGLPPLAPAAERMAGLAAS
jgi:hypothetical protein